MCNEQQLIGKIPSLEKFLHPAIFVYFNLFLHHLLGNFLCTVRRVVHVVVAVPAY